MRIMICGVVCTLKDDALASKCSLLNLLGGGSLSFLLFLSFLGEVTSQRSGRLSFTGCTITRLWQHASSAASTP